MKITTTGEGITCYHRKKEVILTHVPPTISGCLNIPQQVTTIAPYSLSSCVNITSIKIQDRIDTIPPNAFSFCSNLEEIIVSPYNMCYESDDKGVLFTKNKKTLLFVPPKLSGSYIIPAGVERIENSAFYNCKDLTTIIIPSSVKHIGRLAFHNCTALKQITIPKNVETFGEHAFSNCLSLYSITVSTDNKHYSSDRSGVLFNKDKTHLLYAPLTIFGKYAVPEGVTHIKWQAFRSCDNLTEVDLPNSLTNIEHGAFLDCLNLKTVNFGNGLKKIDNSAFAGCIKLEAAFLPDSIEELGEMVFEACKKLTQVWFPKNLTHIGLSLFSGCASLNNISVSPENMHFSEDSYGVLLDKNQTFIIRVPVKLGGRYLAPLTVVGFMYDAFEGCTEIESIFLPVKAKKTDHTFIYCESNPKWYLRDVNGLIYDKTTFEIVHVWKNIEKAKIVEGVTDIPHNLFQNRVKLTEVFIPSSVTSFINNAFRGCKNLKKIKCSTKNTQVWCDEYGVLYNKYNSNYILVWAPPKLKGSYTIPEGVTHIFDFAFENCPKLTDIIIPESVWAIQRNAFYNLSDVTFHIHANSDAEQFFRFENLPCVIE